MQKTVISIIGGHKCTDEVEQLAYKLGKKIAKVADRIVTGGLGGVMEAVCKGVKAGGGITVAFLPGYNKSDANPYVDVAFPTGMGLARNVLVVKAAEVVVALPGQSGTLSEIAYCLQFGIPVISLAPSKIGRQSTLSGQFCTGQDIPGVIKVKTVEQAVTQVKNILRRRVL